MHILDIYVIKLDDGHIARSPDTPDPCYVTPHCPNSRAAANYLASAHIPKSIRYKLTYIRPGLYRAHWSDDASQSHRKGVTSLRVSQPLNITPSPNTHQIP